MKLEIEKHGHRFFEPVLKQIAGLLDKNYELKFDSTESSTTGPSFTVINKKFREHGLHIRMLLSRDGEVEINSFFNHLFPIHPSRYNITPSRDKEDFPLLTTVELSTVETKIKAIEKATLRDIKELAQDFEDNVYGISKDNVFSLHSANNGLDLTIFSNYGIKIDYRAYLLSPSRDMLTNYWLIEIVAKSDKDKKVKELLPDVIDMYLEEVSNQSANNGLKSMRRFKDDIIGMFTKDNEDKYIEMVKSMYPFYDGYEFVPDLDGWVADEYMTILNNSRIENELMSYFYDNTDNEHFLSQEAKDIFLF